MSSDQFDTFDLDKLDKDVYIIGKITMNIINLLDLNIEEKEILMWKDRFGYIEKHKDEFDSEEQYRKHVEAIPDIVQNPDYVGVHPNGSSVEFIKIIEKNMMVAVRLNTNGGLAFRTSYPIKEQKLSNYKKSGRVKEVK